MVDGRWRMAVFNLSFALKVGQRPSANGQRNKTDIPFITTYFLFCLISFLYESIAPGGLYCISESILLLFALMDIISIIKRNRRQQIPRIFPGRRRTDLVGHRCFPESLPIFSAAHFIGMSGSGFALGLAISTYEWMAAATLHSS